MTEEDKNKLLVQIIALREEMEGHKKAATAIYQKIQIALETITEKTNKVVNTALERIQPEINQTVKDGLRDAGEDFEVIAKKVGDKHNQEMNGLWRLLPMASIILGVLAGLAGGALAYFLTPGIDNDVAARLQTGAFFESVWPKLSKSEQDKLTAIAEGKEPETLNKKSKKT
jgi:hypothetical protein